MNANWYKLAEKVKGKKVYAFVCTDAWNKFEDRFRIENGLRLAGCEEVSYFPSWVSNRGYWSMYFKNHKDDLISLYDELCDAESKITLYEYISSIIMTKGIPESTIQPKKNILMQAYSIGEMKSASLTVELAMVIQSLICCRLGRILKEFTR